VKNAVHTSCYEQAATSLTPQLFLRCWSVSVPVLRREKKKIGAKELWRAKNNFSICLEARIHQTPLKGRDSRVLHCTLGATSF